MFRQANSLLDVAGEGVKIVTDTKTRKTKMRLRHRRPTSGWTLVDTLTVAVVVVLLLLFLSGLLLPPIRSSHSKADRIRCVANLSQVGKAFRLWAADHDGKFPFQVPVTNGGTREFISRGKAFVHLRALSNELWLPKVLVCPTDADDSSRRAALTFATNFSDDNVSYFVGLDAGLGYPNAWLAGDRRLKVGGRQMARGIFPLTTNAAVEWTEGVHGKCGNVVLVDGRVHQSHTGLVQAVQLQGLATNRLAIP